MKQRREMWKLPSNVVKSTLQRFITITKSASPLQDTMRPKSTTSLFVMGLFTLRLVICLVILVDSGALFDQENTTIKRGVCMFFLQPVHIHINTWLKLFKTLQTSPCPKIHEQENMVWMPNSGGTTSTWSVCTWCSVVRTNDVSIFNFVFGKENDSHFICCNSPLRTIHATVLLDTS